MFLLSFLPSGSEPCGTSSDRETGTVVLEGKFPCSYCHINLWAVEEPQVEGMLLQQEYLTGTMEEESRAGDGQQWTFPL